MSTFPGAGACAGSMISVLLVSAEGKGVVGVEVLVMVVVVGAGSWGGGVVIAFLPCILSSMPPKAIVKKTPT